MTRTIFAHSTRDAWLLAAAGAQGALLAIIAFSSPRGIAGVVAVILFALGIVWGSNTVAHNHLHRPIFASRALNRALALYLSAVLFVPQTLWAQRHLWHHAGEPPRSFLRVNRRMIVEAMVIAVIVLALRGRLPVLVPGYVLGLLLCQLQGHYEHARGASGVSTYGRLYNALWFNDGYHVEHHARPGEHWTRLPTVRAAAAISAHPPLLRWMDGAATGRALGWLEKLVLASPWLQRFVLARHLRAMRSLLAARSFRRIAVVGGGLYPRTLLVMRALFPSAEVQIIDASADSVARARDHLGEAPPAIVARFDPEAHRGFDLVIFPLAFVGDRGVMKRAAELGATVVAHEWIWKLRSSSRVVSWLLLKRVSLVR